MVKGIMLFEVEEVVKVFQTDSVVRGNRYTVNTTVRTWDTDSRVRATTVVRLGTVQPCAQAKVNVMVHASVHANAITIVSAHVIENVKVIVNANVYVSVM